MEPVRSLRLHGLLMGVVDKGQWSAGEASAIAEVALAQLPFKILRFTWLLCAFVSLVRSTMVYASPVKLK